MKKNIARYRQSDFAGAGLRWLFLATVFLATPAVAGIYTFSTAANAKDAALEPVSGEAIFNVTAGSMTVTLVNFQTNITSMGQDISSLLFTVNNTQSIFNLANAKVTISGSEVYVSSGGVTSPAGTLNNATVGTIATTAVHWTKGQAGNVSSLNDLNGGGSPDQTIIGPAGSNGTYATVNSSIYGNAPHNPYIQKTATFTIAAAGLLSTTYISGVQIGYGTAGNNYITMGKVPEPGSMALLAIGLAAFASSVRRCTL